MLRRLARWLQFAILLIALLLIGGYLSSQWPTLRTYPWRIHAGWLGLAVLFTLGAWVVEIELWRQLLSRLHHTQLPFFAAIRIWFLSALMRYVPGNIWQPISLALYSSRRGIPAEATMTSLALFQVIVLLATVPIVTVFVLLDNNQSLFSRTLNDTLGAAAPWLLAAIVLPSLVLLWRPDWLVALLNWALTRVGRPPLHAQLRRRGLIGLTLLGIADWIIWGAAFAAFAYGVAGSGVGLDPAITGSLVASYSIAYTIGFLALITPSGFGVREGAFLLLLAPRIDPAVIAVLALAMRVWTTVGELLLALISAPFERTAIAPSAPTVPIVPTAPTVPAESPASALDSPTAVEQPGEVNLPTQAN